MILTRSNSTVEKLIWAREAVRCMAWMLVVAIGIIGIAIHGVNQREAVIKAQSEYIATLEATNSDLRARVAQQPTGEITAQEAVSRGNRRTQTMEITGYCACAQCCGKTDGITASGAVATPGRTIACPPSIPFGTEVFIPSIGWRVCEDRGGAITDGHIDVYFDTHQEALNFGRQMMEVVVR